MACDSGEKAPLIGARPRNKHGNFKGVVAFIGMLTIAAVGCEYLYFERHTISPSMTTSEKAFFSSIFSLFSLNVDGDQGFCRDMPGCGAGVASKPDEYGACPGDGSYEKLGLDVGNVAAYDYVLYVAPEARGPKGVPSYESARNLIGRADCQAVLANLKDSTPSWSFHTVADALHIFKNKRVIFVGDSLTRGAFRDLCYWLGGSSPPGRVQTSLKCTPGAAMANAGVELSSRWIPYADTSFSEANFTDLMENSDIAVVMAGNWYARYSTPHYNNSVKATLEELKNQTMSRGLGVDAHAARVKAQLSLQALKLALREEATRYETRPRSELVNKKLKADGLEGYSALLSMIARQPADVMKGKKIVVRSPPVFGNPYVHEEAGSLHNDFHDFNKILLSMQQITEGAIKSNTELIHSGYLTKGNVRYLDSSSYSYNATSGLRTSCPLFTAAKENCACHMADELGWRSMNQQLLNALC